MRSDFGPASGLQLTGHLLATCPQESNPLEARTRQGLDVRYAPLSRRESVFDVPSPPAKRNPSKPFGLRIPAVSERTSPFTARQGFEPRLNGPKPFVLPLHHQASEGRINCGESPRRQALKLTKNAKPRIDDPNALWLNAFLMSSDTNPASEPKYKRIILKLSGEVLRSSKQATRLTGIPWPGFASRLRKSDPSERKWGSSWGGNIFRGLSGSKDRGVDRTLGTTWGCFQR